jgi:hypothetical protein
MTIKKGVIGGYGQYNTVRTVTGSARGYVAFWLRASCFALAGRLDLERGLGEARFGGGSGRY